MLETTSLSQLKSYVTTSNPSLSLFVAAATDNNHLLRPTLFSLCRHHHHRPPPPSTYPLFSLPPPPPPIAPTSDLSSLFSVAATTDTYRGDFSPPAALRAKALNRIGNLLVHDDNYRNFEDWIIPIFDQMLEQQSTKVF